MTKKEKFESILMTDEQRYRLCAEVAAERIAADMNVNRRDIALTEKILVDVFLKGVLWANRNPATAELQKLLKGRGFL
jgi:hypothetical protein